VSLPSGTTLGPYEILGPLGAGGMGEVYRALDTRLNRRIAIKVLPSGLADDRDRLRRFEQEAQAASALKHPNILTIHDIGHEAGVAFIAMEWVQGKTLRDLLANGRLPPQRVAHIAHQIADGLAQAHAAGGRVRIAVELVEVATQQTRWSDQYDRELADVLAVQSQVALQLAERLAATLSPAERERVDQRATHNPDAYALYLRAQAMRGMADPKRNLEAIDRLGRALALDPQLPGPRLLWPIACSSGPTRRIATVLSFCACSACLSVAGSAPSRIRPRAWIASDRASASGRSG
jgi:hypothetical protein